MHVGGFDERSGKRLIESVDTGETSVLSVMNMVEGHTQISRRQTQTRSSGQHA